MDVTKIFDALAISGSGLSAQRRRLSVIAENIAHAHDTNRGDGTPYRRKTTVCETELQGKMDGLVQVSGVIEDDKTPLERVHMLGDRRPGCGDGLNRRCVRHLAPSRSSNARLRSTPQR